MTKEFENQVKTAALPTSFKTIKKGKDFKMDFKREDWTLFRNVNTLGQRAGVTAGKIGPLVVKELVDNALDAAGACRYGWLDERTPRAVFVENGGSGLEGDDRQIADLFSVSRPLTSSKMLRLPTRGALGNGLRVVSGAVLASGGSLVVRTSGRSLDLHPREGDGGTDVNRIGEWSESGTRVEVTFGPGLPTAVDMFRWADLATARQTGVRRTRERRVPGGTIPIRFTICSGRPGNGQSAISRSVFAAVPAQKPDALPRASSVALALL